MARKTEMVTIEKGRDKGKKFRITEMSAMKAEKWARRAIFAAFSSGQASISGLAEKFVQDKNKDLQEAERLGMAYIADQGLQLIGRIPEEVADALYDELLACVKFLPDPKNQEVEMSIDEDTCEDPQTLIKLRVKAFMLHVDFFQPAES